MKPSGPFRIGTEAEKTGVHLDGSAIEFGGPSGVKAVLDALAARYGWHQEAEYDGGPPISLKRSGASVTLEPGGQLELSGAPLDDIHAAAAEFDAHLAEVHEVSRELGLAWLGVGFHPFARRDQLQWVPKLRYGVMQTYLPTRGAHAIDMMLRTCTVQANFDFSSEADAVRKLRVSLGLSPIVTAMFAASPWVERRATGDRSHRARVWLDVDPDRTGLLPFVWDDGMSFQRYIEWALDVPMFLVKRGKRIVKNTGQTFRAFLRDGFEGERATEADWETHINTVFPEVRLKRTLEVRGADAQPPGLTAALPALWTGVLYDAVALDAAERLVSGLAPDVLERARPDIAARALQAELGGRPVAEYANELLSIAEAGLERRARRDAQGRDERIHLGSLAALTRAGKSPADLLLETVGQVPTMAGLLAHARLA